MKAPDRAGQVFEEVEGDRRIILVTRSYDHSHRVLVLANESPDSLLHDVWYEDAGVGDWDAYDGFIRRR